MTFPPGQMPLRLKLRDDATLSNYQGSAAARLLTAGSVVYLWGKPGSGRSHLLQGLCHEVAGRGGSTIFIDAPAAAQPQILEGLEGFELVCVDDIDTVCGQSEAWEVALFHLVNAVRDQGGKLVMAGLAAPRELQVRLADLKSRLLAAEQLETDHLDDEEKLAVLKHKAEGQGFLLTDEVGRFIMRRSDRNMTALISLLERLETESLRRQKLVTVPFVRELLFGS